MKYQLPYPELDRESQIFPSENIQRVRFYNVTTFPIVCGVLLTASSMKQQGQTPPQGYPVENISFDIPFTSPAARIGNNASNSTALAKEFHALVSRWKEETFFLSSLSKMFTHPAYQRIIAMGTNGLSLVFSELQKGQGNWFYALKYMAGVDVAAGIKSYEDARAAWLEWGYKNDYI